MRKSSAKRSQPDLFERLASEEHSAQQSTLEASDPAVTDDGTSASVNIPNLGLPNQAYAHASRHAGRLNASTISEAEYQSLLSERQKLLDKKFDGSMTRRESNRLEYVRWSLDRIEDARFGPGLDALESAVGRFEQFLGQVEDLKSRLVGRTKGLRD